MRRYVQSRSSGETSKATDAGEDSERHAHDTFFDCCASQAMEGRGGRNMRNIVERRCVGHCGQIRHIFVSVTGKVKVRQRPRIATEPRDRTKCQCIINAKRSSRLHVTSIWVPISPVGGRGRGERGGGGRAESRAQREVTRHIHAAKRELQQRNKNNRLSSWSYAHPRAVRQYCMQPCAWRSVAPAALPTCLGK